MLIKDWWYAIRVCLKYRIWWNPFCFDGNGHYHYSGFVSVSPFSRNFISVFMHEVGHHVHDKKVRLFSYLVANKDELRFTGSCRSIYRVLESEALASRFAAKTGKASRKYLVTCFNTYSAAIFCNMSKPIVVNEFSQILDCVYKNSRRIEK